MKRHIPFLLTTFRLLLGPVALACAWARVPRIIFLPILTAGTLSDIFDGILARRFHVSTQRSRRYDSATDIVYYLFLLATLWTTSKQLITQMRWAIAVIAISELASIGISLIRFRRYPAAHTYLAKFYALAMLAALIALLVFNGNGWVVLVLASIAVVANLEIIAIHLLVNTPPVDISSIFQVRAGPGHQIP